MLPLSIQGTAFTYTEFLSFIDSLVADHKTSGPIQTEALINFTALNAKRMQRLNKTFKLEEKIIQLLENLPEQQWVLISEAWCGDSAQSLPIINKIAQASKGKIKLSIILRDENNDWITRYHTNGSKSIPKLIGFDKEGNELFIWGPRPAQAQRLFTNWKSDPKGRTKDEFEVELHTWYAQDKGNSVVEELMQLLNPMVSALAGSE